MLFCNSFMLSAWVTPHDDKPYVRMLFIFRCRESTLCGGQRFHQILRIS